ncbi:T-cell surface antigen CD2-like isoform X2 [Hemiscyllium ocellatum]|uniref:T-cell surface antigen CD2-like isoform X2 n=1 Tax=Hemiscyllium ocellatum TaxID=170820 RepID=UPI002967423A|nr:T-cell surface antigen CD2-like isoform X2 [Hemiscyllium ocellatum]
MPPTRVHLINCKLGLFLAESKGETTDVYGEIGKSVFLHAKSESSKTDDIKWMKGDVMIARYKNQTPKSYRRDYDGIKVYPNGTLTFKIMKSNEGTYHCEIYGTDGKLKSLQSTQLHILESVSKPVLNFKCISQKANITCEVETGTNFTMSLVGGSLTARTHSHQYLNVNKILGMNENVEFVCTVSNNISSANTSRVIECSETEAKSIVNYFLMILAGGISVAIIFIILMIYCILRCCRRKRESVDTEMEVPMEFREQMKQSRQPIPGPRKHNEEYSVPRQRAEPRKPREGAERMDGEERAQRAARAERAQRTGREERAERAQRADDSQRAERAQGAKRAHRAEREQRGEKGEKMYKERRQRGERTLEGDRLQRIEHPELRVNRGPVPLPPQSR